MTKCEINHRREGGMEKTMGELETRKFAGIDLGRLAVQFSVYDEAAAQTTEESFPLPEEDREHYIESGLLCVRRYLEANQLGWEDYHGVYFTMEDTSPERREELAALLDEDFKKRHSVKVITHFRAFVEYVFHQEKAVWDRNTLLLDYTGNVLRYILVEQIRPSRQKAYRAELKELDLTEFDIHVGEENQDYHFSRLMKQFLVKNPAHIIFLTGSGFDGGWMKKTLTYLCAGRRVFLGQNLYANGACLLGLGPVQQMEDGLLLMQGPEMVCHTIGVLAQESGKARYIPITSIGREWYNTKGSMDIILDKSQKIEFFYHNSQTNDMVGAVCEIRDLPARPPKTTRIRVEVRFHSQTDGVILLKDLGFGDMFPATGKVTVFPFKLIQ